MKLISKLCNWKDGHSPYQFEVGKFAFGIGTKASIVSFNIVEFSSGWLTLIHLSILGFGFEIGIDIDE